MKLTDNARNYHDRMYPGYESTLAKTDPEFIERFDNFAFDEVINEPHARVDEAGNFVAVSHAVYLPAGGADGLPGD